MISSVEMITFVEAMAASAWEMPVPKMRALPKTSAWWTWMRATSGLRAGTMVIGWPGEGGLMGLGPGGAERSGPPEGAAGGEGAPHRPGIRAFVHPHVGVLVRFPAPLGDPLPPWGAGDPRG